MKVLIWDKNIVLKNTGGPSGYLYNIQQFLKESEYNEINFYSDYFKKKEVKNIKAPKNIFSKIYIYLIRFWISLYKIYFYTEKLTKDEIDLINKFDFVHLHSIEDMRKYFLKNKMKINAKTILTSHCPEPFIDEFSSQSYYMTFFQKNKFLRNYFIKKEIEAFNITDYIMFPVEQAKEVYTNSSIHYKKCFEYNKAKFFYVPTAIIDNVAIGNDKHIDKFVNKDKICVCFIGRHSHIKGYDKLVEIARNVWKKTDEVTFVLGGMKSSIVYPEDEKWIELGWVKTSDILNEIDVFILPNKQTYFDLIFLEVLRQGVPVIASFTGGNKWFVNKSRGILLYNYDDIEAASNHILNCLDLKKKNCLSDLGKENRCLYEKEFVLSCYVETYITNINNLH